MTSLKTTPGQGKGSMELPSNGQISGASDRQGIIVAKALDATIQTIDAINKLASIDLAKKILTGISSILVLLQSSFKNKEDLEGLLRNCEDICSTLALATKGASMSRMSDALRNALDALHSSINDLQSRLEDALRYSRITIEISAWTADLGRSLTSFNARLNMVSVIRLEQVHELLQQADVPILIPRPPPPCPAMFFGREKLLCELKDALLRDEDVILVGPGGIGKSTLAMAVMNEEDVIDHYSRRFFVAYSGINPKTVTFVSFVDHVVSVLGLQMSGADSERHIKMNLGLSPVLLVLANAETFVDAVDQDEATQISDFIAHIANTSGVTVLLTSQTSSNVRGISWTEFDVPPLTREPARQAFRKFYQGEISDDELDGLLAGVDFHPLSISILASTAKENRWPAKTLLERWNSPQRSELLQTGEGKDKLRFTIRLSLESPSVKALGDDAVRVLWIVAFFPQGINQDHLTHLFPSLPQISSLVHMLCKVSLIYRSGSFLMILAPIRLFVLDAFQTTGLHLLSDIRSAYYSSLPTIAEENDPHSELLISDYLNIEHLIMCDIVHPLSEIKTISSTCYGFLFGLVPWHKPRPMLLGPVISSFPEGSINEKTLKALSLSTVGNLYAELSNYTSSRAASLAARTLFVAVGNHNMASLCTSSAAVLYNLCGDFSQGKQLLEAFIRSPSWKKINQNEKMDINFMLDMSRMHMSSENVDTLFLHSVNHSFLGLESRVYHWTARMYHGYSTREEVQMHLELLRSDCMSSSRASDRWIFLAGMAEAAFLQRKFDAATDLLNEAYESANSSFHQTTSILPRKAAVASEQGDYDLARSLLRRGLNACSMVAPLPSPEFLHMAYLQGRNELYAGHYLTACQLLAEVVVDCDAQGDIYTKILCIRALGEVDILLDRMSDSDRYFTQAVELCGGSGVPPGLLGVCNPMLRLDDDKFLGWKRFLQAHAV